MLTVRLKRFDRSKHYESFAALVSREDDLAFWMPLACLNTDKDLDYYIDTRFSRYYHEFFVVENRDNGLMGVVYSHDYHPNDGHAMVSIALGPEYRDKGYGAVAMGIFLDFLFNHYSIRKVFATIYGYNKRSLAVSKRAGFCEEGCLKEYRYLNGRYHDLHYLSITREAFYRLHRTMIESIKTNTTEDSQKDNQGSPRSTLVVL